MQQNIKTKTNVWSTNVSTARKGISMSSGPLSDLVECTGLVGADPTQVSVFLGGLSTIVLKTVPECDCTGLTRALIRQCIHTPLGWDWLLDLQELHDCDTQLFHTLVAVGEHLRSSGGQLSLQNLNTVPMPESLRDQFSKNCGSVFIQVEDSDEASNRGPRAHKIANERQRHWTRVGAMVTTRL